MFFVRFWVVFWGHFGTFLVPKGDQQGYLRFFAFQHVLVRMRWMSVRASLVSMPPPARSRWPVGTAVSAHPAGEGCSAKLPWTAAARFRASTAVTVSSYMPALARTLSCRSNACVALASLGCSASSTWMSAPAVPVRMVEPVCNRRSAVPTAVHVRPVSKSA